MRLHVEAGNTGAALHQYEVCRDMLNGELAVRPSAETEALHRRIRESSPADEAVRPRAEEMLALRIVTSQLSRCLALGTHRSGDPNPYLLVGRFISIAKIEAMTSAMPVP